MTPLTSVHRAWLVIDDKRKIAIRRRMRRPPVSVGSVVGQMQNDGAAWLDDLGAEYGIARDDMVDVAELVHNMTARNLIPLVHLGVLDLENVIKAAIAAGFACGYFTRAEQDSKAAVA